MKAILQTWNFIRILRLVLGVAILVQGIISKDIPSIFLGIVFAALPFFNVGCCGSNSCAIDSARAIKNKINIDDEEVDTLK